MIEKRRFYAAKAILDAVQKLSAGRRSPRFTSPGRRALAEGAAGNMSLRRARLCRPLLPRFMPR